MVIETQSLGSARNHEGRHRSNRMWVVVWIAAFLSLARGVPSSAQELFSPPDETPRFMALSTSAEIDLDGRIDEAIWQNTEPIVSFAQKEPDQGEPGSYRTEVRVIFDEVSIYIAAICEQPRSTLRVQTLQRDFYFGDNDAFGVAIDGFMDERNALAFQTTPRGNQSDLEVVDGGDTNDDWNARWDVRTHIEDDRWTVEMAIPWKTLRYPDGVDRLGMIFSRNIRHLNQLVTAPPVPRVMSTYRMAYEGELVGIRAPAPAANVTFTPYALGSRFENGETSSDVEVGGEAKWAITPSTVLDMTVNTDFAQAEVDRQVVNLARFSVFFPERRQFFLENSNLFDASLTTWIKPFFSRRIGLDRRGRPIGIDGGVRLTSRSKSHEVGILSMRQRESGDQPASTFGVARYSRNLSDQSRLGGMVTWRRDDELVYEGVTMDPNNNFTFTADGSWRPRPSAGVNAMVSMSQDDASGSGIGSQLWAFYENNWFYVGLLEYYNRDYNPRAGLEILDTNYVMHSPGLSLDLRSERMPGFVRSFNPGVEAYLFQSSDDGEFLFGYAPIRPFQVHLQNGASVTLIVEPHWQRLDSSFYPAGIEVAPGDYDFTRFRSTISSDQSAELATFHSAEAGNYYDGSLVSYYGSLRYAPIPEIRVAAEVDINRFRDLGIEQQDDDAEVFGLSARFALNPRTSVRAQYQRNSVGDRSIWNARFAWEYSPLSYLYFVYNRDEGGGLGGDATEQFIVKLTYLLGV